MTLTDAVRNTALPPRVKAGSPTVASEASQHPIFEKLYAPISAELLQVEATLQSELSSHDHAVNELLRHGIRLGGKRLRPALLLLTAKACGGIRDEHLLLAAVLEMIHLATLVHDDVLDEATMRRHRKTVNVVAGNEVSVLVGDFLFSHAFYLASTLDSTFGCQRIGRTTNVVCEGEMRQIYARCNYDLTEEQYFSIIEAKTAELCACCCELGASYAGVDQARTRELREFGRNIGLAFQIVDDLLDLTGKETRAGKSLGTDLDQQKLTLPLIRLLAISDPSNRQQIIDLIASRSPEARKLLAARLHEADAFTYARSRAAEYIETAKCCLIKLPDSPARRSLAAMTQFVLAREH